MTYPGSPEVSSSDPGSPPAAPGPTATGHIPLVRVVRGGVTECVHYGSIVVTDPTGRVHYAAGDASSVVFPRSSNKPFQAATALDAGAQLAGESLALSAASHRGEPGHVELVLRMLAAVGLTEDDLGCPADYPGDTVAYRAAIARGERPARRYMNCSGKHAGMLTACVAAGWDTASYLDPRHPLQQAIAARIERLAGEPIGAVSVDGCGAPLLGLSLAGLARAFGAVLRADEGTSERRVADAMRAYPWLIAGTDQDDTVLMDAHPGLLMKGGAEGIHCAALPDGRAVALKISDGAARARMPVLTAVLRQWGLESVALDRLATSPVLGGGQPVGVVELIPGALPF